MRRAVLVFAVACSGKKSEPPPPQPVPAAVHVVPADAGITELKGYDPNAGHLDDTSGEPRPVPPPAPHAGRPIEITLRSSPPNAQVAVDGTLVGTTPAYWSGVADGQPHEFVFTLPRFGMARYRFVPVTSGVVHARLEPVGSTEETDAGVPPGVPRNPTPVPVVDPAPAPVAPPPDATGDAAPPPPVGPTP